MIRVMLGLSLRPAESAVIAPSTTIQAILFPSSSRFHSETTQCTATAPSVSPTQAAAPMPSVWIRAPAATPSGMKPLTLVGLLEITASASATISTSRNADANSFTPPQRL